MDVAALVRTLRSSDRAAAARAMEALYSLCPHQPSETMPMAVLRAIRTAGGIPVLVRYLQMPVERAMQAGAASLLANIAMHPAGADAICAVPEAIPALVRVLRDAGDGKIAGEAQHAATTTLRNLAAARGPACSADIAAAGAIPALVCLLQRACSKGSSSSSTSTTATIATTATTATTTRGTSYSKEGVGAAAAHALAHLSIGSPGNIAAIGAAGGIPPLVQCLRSTHLELQLAGATALFDVTANSPQNKAAVQAAGGIPFLVQLLQGGSTEAQAQAAGALGNLSSGGPALQAAVVNAGTIPALTRLLRSGDAGSALPAVQARVAGCLRSVLDDCPAACQAAAAAGAAPLLAQLLANGSGDSLLEAASAALCHMSYSTRPSRAAVEAQDCLPILVRLGMKKAAQRGAGDARQQGAASVLQFLSLSHELEGGGSSGSTAVGGGGGSSNSTVAAAAAAAGSRPGAPRAKKVCAAPGGGATSGLKLCGGCLTARYCSKGCMRSHWKVHKPECRRLQAAAASGPQ